MKINMYLYSICVFFVKWMDENGKKFMQWAQRIKFPLDIPLENFQLWIRLSLFTFWISIEFKEPNIRATEKSASYSTTRTDNEQINTFTLVRIMRRDLFFTYFRINGCVCVFFPPDQILLVQVYVCFFSCSFVCSIRCWEETTFWFSMRINNWIMRYWTCVNNH